MSAGGGSLSFKKQQPGARCVFQPADLNEYEQDAWDIRISIGDAPLEEAFYFTMEDPKAVDLPISHLLRDYALNPAHAAQLDVAEYPELPFMQTELGLYMENKSNGVLDVELYANNSATPGPIDTYRNAREYLSVCTTDDGSLDYRVLDLVLTAAPKSLSRYESNDVHRSQGHIYLLLLMDWIESRGQWKAFVRSPIVRDFTKNERNTTYPNVAETFSSMAMRRLLPTPSIRISGKEKNAFTLTDEARREIEVLKAESKRIAQEYDRFDSCSIAPPALGVPGGFDVRVQMIEYDGLDIRKSVLLRVLEDHADAYFSGEWAATFESLAFYENVRDALAYKTNFSREILESLKRIATGDG